MSNMIGTHDELSVFDVEDIINDCLAMLKAEVDNKEAYEELNAELRYWQKVYNKKLKNSGGGIR